MAQYDVPPSITLLVGLPASGKSTYVKSYLKDHPNTVVVSSDDIIENYANRHGKTYNEVFHEYIDAAEVQFREELKIAISDKKDILVDRTNLSVRGRNKILANVPKTYNKYAIIFTVSDEDLEKRMEQRLKETGKSVPKNIMETMKASYVMPSEKEGFTSVIAMPQLF